MSSIPRDQFGPKELGFRAVILSWIEPRRRWIVRATVIFALFTFLSIISALLSLNKILYAVALAAAPLAFAVALLLQAHLELAPIAILFAGGFIPFSLPTGTDSRLVIALVLAIMVMGLWLLRMAVIEHRFSLKPSAVNLPFLGFSAITLLSLIWSNIFRDPSVYVPGKFIVIQVAQAMVMIVSPGITLLIANFIDKKRQLQWLVKVMLAIGFLGLITEFTPLNLPVNTGGLTAAWVVALSIGLSLYERNLHRGWRAALLAIGLLWIVWGFVLHMSWLAGWLPGFVALAVITFFRSRRMFFVTVLILGLYVFINKSYINQDLQAESITSGDTRLAAWEFNWSITSQHLLLGTGPAGYVVYYMTYAPNQAMATHSNYLDILSETGLLGTIFFLWMFAALAWRGIKTYWRLRKRGDFYEALAIASLGGLAGCIVIMGFGDWLIPFAYTQTIAGFSYTIYSWIFIGALMALDQMLREGKIPAVKSGIS
jgi:hypothetical protein